MNNSECFPTHIIFPHALFSHMLLYMSYMYYFSDFQTKKYFIFF